MKMTPREKLSYVLIILAIVITLIMIIWYALSHSPTDIQTIIALVVTPYLFIFTMYERLNNRINDKYDKLNDRITTEISDVRKDFQKELGEIKQTLGRMWLRAEGSQTRV